MFLNNNLNIFVSKAAKKPHILKTNNNKKNSGIVKTHAPTL